MSLEFPPPINDFFKQIKKGGPAFEFESNSRLESSEHDLGLKNSGGDRSSGSVNKVQRGTVPEKYRRRKEVLR